MTDVVRTRTALAKRLAGAPRPVGLVPTMGALHAGHVALIERARGENATVVVSIFVNPLQFGAAADLARYPRDLQRDLAHCEAAGADVVWAPEVLDVYPTGGVQVGIDPGPLARELEGASRVGHFAGALTVVAKLFGTVRPERAYFGEKDYQQLVLVRQMAADLDLGVDVRGVATVREPGGLARSSRNVFLSEGERRAALALSAALTAGAARHTATDVLRVARDLIDLEPEVALDYLELRAPDLAPAPRSGAARLLVAAQVGSVRLIDNVALTLE